MVKIYQVVSATDGSRSEPFSTASLTDLAIIADALPDDRKDDYVLMLIEDADGSPFMSRAPMMTMRTIAERYGNPSLPIPE